MANIAKYITGIASLSFLFISAFEAQTSIGQRMVDNREGVRAIVTDKQTDHFARKVNQAAVEANMHALDRYVGTWQAAK